MLKARGILSLALLVLFVALSGCNRAVVATEIQADGGWKRTVKLYGGSDKKDASMPMSMSIDDVFQVPKGAGWQIKRGVETPKNAKPSDNPFAGAMDAGEVYTAERTMKAGESLDHDVVIKNGTDKVKPLSLVNSVSVKQIAPNRIEYTEVYRWKGEPLSAAVSKDKNFGAEEMMKSFKRRLPPQLATPVKMQKLQRIAMEQGWLLIFGPNDPMLMDIMSLFTFPDAALRRLARKLSKMIDTTLKETFGNALPEAQRLEIVRAVTKEQSTVLSKQATEGATANSPLAGGGGNSKKDTSFVPITISVRFPGKVTKTNGEYDPYLNEVYWTFYAPAAQARDIVLTATCETSK
jgi:hypothetical protein